MGGNMKLLRLLTIITFLMTTFGGDSMARIKSYATDNTAFQQQEDVTLLEFLYEVGKTYDCFFTIEEAWQDGEPSNQVEATRIERSLSKNNLRNALNSLQQAAPNLIYVVSRENPRIVHIIDSRLTRQSQYGLETIVKRVDFTGTVGELVNELSRLGVPIQPPPMVDIHEARFMNSQTKVKVIGQGLKVRGILSNYIPLDDHGRILWIARTCLASGEISNIQFRR
jgi:hypothetical protein